MHVASTAIICSSNLNAHHTGIPPPFAPSPHPCENKIHQQDDEWNMQGLGKVHPSPFVSLQPPSRKNRAHEWKMLGPCLLICAGGTERYSLPLLPLLQLNSHDNRTIICAQRVHTAAPHLLPAPHSHEQTMCNEHWDPPHLCWGCRKVCPYFSPLCHFTTQPSPVAAPPPLCTCHLPLLPPVCHMHRGLLPFPRTPEEGGVPQTVFACAPPFLLSCAAPTCVPPPPSPFAHVPPALVPMCGVCHVLRAGVNGCVQTEMWWGGTACTPATARPSLCPPFRVHNSPHPASAPALMDVAFTVLGHQHE